MTKDQILDNVKSCIVQFNSNTKIEQVTLDTNLTKEAGLDSLDIIEFIMEMEKLCDLRIEDEDADSLQTVNDVVEYIYNKKNK